MLIATVALIQHMPREDSFALLAWLRDAPGADTIQVLLEKAKEKQIEIHVSWINIAEVYYITQRRCLETDPQLAARPGPRDRESSDSD